MNSEECEENDYGHDLDLLLVLHLSRDSHPKKSGCRAKNIHLRTTCINLD